MTTSSCHRSQRILCSVALLLCCLVPGVRAWAAPSGRELLETGHADEAIRVLSAQANNAEGYNLLCRAYYSVEQWDLAVRNCERAVKLEPTDGMYHLWLGRSYGEKANVTKNLIFAYQLARKTVAEFVRAHQLDPKNVAIARDLSEYYTTAPAIVGGSLEKAQALAAELAPEHPVDAAWVRAMAASSAGRHDEAEHQYEEAIRLDHDSATTNLNLAHYLRGHKEWDRLQQVVEHAMRSQQIRPTDRYDGAELLLRAGRDLENAARFMRGYIESGHASEAAPLARAHYLLGEILQKLGDPAQAANEYRAALGLASSYRAPADALRRMGQSMQAKQ